MQSHKRTSHNRWLHLSNSLIPLYPYCEKCKRMNNSSSDRGVKMESFVKAAKDVKNYVFNKSYKIMRFIDVIMKGLENGRLKVTS